MFNQYFSTGGTMRYSVKKPYGAGRGPAISTKRRHSINKKMADETSLLTSDGTLILLATASFTTVRSVKEVLQKRPRQPQLRGNLGGRRHWQERRMQESRRPSWERLQCLSSWD